MKQTRHGGLTGKGCDGYHSAMDQTLSGLSPAPEVAGGRDPRPADRQKIKVLRYTGQSAVQKKHYRSIPEVRITARWHRDSPRDSPWQLWASCRSQIPRCQSVPARFLLAHS